MPADLDERVRATFADSHRRVFLGDAAANPRLRVEVIAAPDLDPFGSVNLVADVSGLPSQDRARALDSAGSRS